MTPINSPFLVVSGPTASGKSTLAVRLAQALEREVINIDSVQIYKGLTVGSAQLLEEEQGGITHHLIAERDITESLDAKWYREQVLRIHSSLQEQGKESVLCVGTNLYLLSLLYDLAQLPRADAATRVKLESQPTSELYQELEKCDREAAARIHPNDKLRIVRALEVAQLSSDCLTSAHQAHQQHAQPLSALMLVLVWNRQELYDRINQRTDKMLADGLIDEVVGVKERYGDAFPASRSIGYAEVLDFLRAEQPEQDLLRDSIAQNTRRFAKRQFTFWRNEPRKRGWALFPLPGEGKILGDEVLLGGKKQQAEGVSVFSYSLEQLQERVSQRLSERFSGCEVWYLDAQCLFDGAA